MAVGITCVLQPRLCPITISHQYLIQRKAEDKVHAAVMYRLPTSISSVIIRIGGKRVNSFITAAEDSVKLAGINEVNSSLSKTVSV